MLVIVMNENWIKPEFDTHRHVAWAKSHSVLYVFESVPHK